MEDKSQSEVLTIKDAIKIIKSDESIDVEPLKLKVYKKRWLMLIIYMIYSGSNSFQWIEYSIITNVITRYYGVSSMMIDWTSMLFLAIYTVFIFPASYMTDKCGLRWTIIIGAGINCLGTWIKMFSIQPDRIYVVFIGQSIVALAQTMILPLPGRLAAQWFPPTQLSTATSLSIFGNQLGVALGFLLGPIIVKNHNNLDDIGKDLSRLCWMVAIVCTIAFALVLTCKSLTSQKDYHVLIFSLCNGEEDAGRIGLIMILTGMIGSVSFGIILDKTHKYKQTAVTVYFLTFCGQILFTVFTCMGIKWMVYVSAIFLGYFMSGYLAMGFDLCTEFTYPESENIPAGLLNITTSIYGIILITSLGLLMNIYGDIPVHICLCLALLLGFILTAITKDKQRRQDAIKRAQFERIARIEKQTDGVPEMTQLTYSII
ncbi:Feline leukemia virus subgroup C receptor-related protein 2 [Atta colombica]|uniref:Feline leukemia virus subgroup C receptor-related protein 2 n=1 Tax=Atta colombica TaxID=520822 RepID=A0A195B1K4_9HYME|nr:Feline leukemia virus subgroup C receptor-related protein 2 [Atta colombica]